MRPGSPGGGGYQNGVPPLGAVLAMVPGSSGGGGLVQSSGAPLAGYGGCGGPGPGALIGIGGMT